jgi:peptide/nickel transport system substrate-binding protein
MGASSRRAGHAAPREASPHLTRRDLIALSTLSLAAGRPGAAFGADAQGRLTYGVHVSLAPSWLDPAETNGLVTPFMLLYALHDGVAKAMPDQLYAPSLAESWSATEDGLTYDFILKKGVVFHNGDPVTAEDVKFSFLRYHGTDHAALKQRVDTIETPDVNHVRFRLKSAWPDFLTFYAGSTGAGWVVPRRYVEKVGEEGFKKAPIGAGPYRFVSFTPGVELVMEAFPDYWRKTPRVRQLVLKVIPDEATRLAALKRGEIDIAYSIRGELADELRHSPGLSLKPVVIHGTFYLYFPEQFDARSPWHDPRVRLAASRAIDRKTINQALTLGYSHLTGASVFPEGFDFYWQPPEPIYNPAEAKQLLAAAGHPNGFDAGFYYCDSSYANLAEAVLNYLQEAGIRARLRPIERAAFIKGYAEKSFRNIIQSGTGAFGNVATRLESLVVKGGAFSYGSYPDIDELFPRQAAELDRGKRAAILTKMQQMVHERTMFVPIWQLAFLNGVGPRVAESSFGRIRGYPYTAPYDELALTNA